MSLFATIEAGPECREVSWPELTAWLRPYRTAPGTTKKAQGMYSPAEFLRGKYKRKSDVLAVHFGVVDVDDVDDETLGRLLATREAGGFAMCLYSTWQNPLARVNGRWRLRAVLPFDRPVLPEEQKRFWAGWRTLWPFLDDTCKDQSRCYFAPGMPPDARDEHFVHLVWPGNSIPVDRLIALAPTVAEAQRPTPMPVGIDALIALARALKRNSNPARVDLGARLKLVIDGLPFADPGNRDNITWCLAREIAYALPNATPESVAELFLPSLTQMAWTVDVADKIRRQQNTIHENQATIIEAKDADQKSRVSEAFASDRTTGYLQQELEAFGDMRHRWVIQYGSSYYFFVNGTYTPPYPRDAANNAVLRDLAPAYACGQVELHHMKDGAVFRKDLAALVDQYGSVAKYCSVNLVAQRSHYNSDSFTLIEAPCPLDPTLTPQYDPHVDGYLRALAGPKVDKLLSWIAWLTQLDTPCAALFLSGFPGSGKSMLAYALARLWRARPPMIAQAMSTFNQALMQCPLVFADETLPGGKSSELREFIQARSRPLHRKFLPDATLDGAIRLYIAANNPRLLSFDGHLDTNDIDAIAERFIHISVRPEGRMYLAGVPHHRQWVSDGTVARHALWLATQRPAPDGRFLVRDNDDSTYRQLIVLSGGRSAVCRWLVQYLLNPMPVDSSRAGLTIRKHGKLLTSVRGIEAQWGAYVQGEKCPTTQQLTAALHTLSNGTAQEGREKLHVIDLDNLAAWMRITDFASPEVAFGSLYERDMA